MIDRKSKTHFNGKITLKNHDVSTVNYNRF